MNNCCEKEPDKILDIFWHLKKIDETDAGDGQKFGYGFTYVRGGNVAGLTARGRNGSDATGLNWQASKSCVRLFSWNGSLNPINKPLRNSRKGIIEILKGCTEGSWRDSHGLRCAKWWKLLKENMKQLRGIFLAEKLSDSWCVQPSSIIKRIKEFNFRIHSGWSRMKTVECNTHNVKLEKIMWPLSTSGKTWLWLMAPVHSSFNGPLLFLSASCYYLWNFLR